jgi:zinc protease
MNGDTMRILTAAALLLSFAYHAAAQNYIKQKEYYHELVNGLKLMVVQDAAAIDTKIILTVNAGTSHESKDAQGVTMLIAALAGKQLNTAGIEKQVMLHNDYTHYFLTLNGNKDISNVFSTLAGAMNYYPQDSSELVNASFQTVTNKTTASNYNNAENRAAHFIYSDNTHRLGITANDSSIVNTSFKKTVAFKKKYYCPQNAYLIVYGNLDHNEVYKTALNNFLIWKDCSYSVALNMPAAYIRTGEFNSQLLNFTESDSFICLSLIQPAPATINSRKDVLCAMLFSKLLSDSTSAVNTFIKDSLKIAKAEFIYSPAKYTCTSQFNFYSDTATAKQFLSIYSKREYLKDSLLYAENNLTHAKQQLNASFDKFTDTTSYLFAMARYMSLTSLDHFSKLTDSVNAISQSDMTKFVSRYIADNTFAAILNISQSAFDSLSLDSIFTETDVTPDTYEFSFAKNTNIFQLQIGDSIVPYNYDSLLNSLAQWIKINPTKVFKINGVASDDELLSVRDDAMINFFNNHPGFQFAPENLIPTKKMRLDVYRSMTIVKALVEKGVSIRQLSGTGKLLTAKEAEKEPGQKVYCSIKNL